MISKDLLGCSAARNKGTCKNRLTIRRDALEASVLEGLRSHLMEPELFAAFCGEFTLEVNRLRIERDAEIIERRKELERIDRELEKAIQAILDGVPGAMLKDKIGALEDRKIELSALVEQPAQPVPLLHPNLAVVYRERIARLCDSLNDDEGMPLAAEVLRTLIDQILLVPDGGKLAIVLRGDLAAMLSHSADKQKPGSLSGAGLSQVSLVAGTAPIWAAPKRLSNCRRGISHRPWRRIPPTIPPKRLRFGETLWIYAKMTRGGRQWNCTPLMCRKPSESTGRFLSAADILCPQ
jgi:site-specific DNA recombinase